MTEPPTRSPKGDAASVVADEIEVLLAELGLVRSRPGQLLDQRFEDLGLGSLELNELVSRLERRLAVVVPADVLAKADTAGDLADAIARADHRRSASDLSRTRSSDRPEPDRGEAIGIAEGETLIEVFDWHCARHPDRAHLRLLDEPEEAQHVTYGQLRAAAVAVAVGLVEHGVTPGETVALVLPTGRAYFETFLGILAAGAVPVPIYPPARRSQLAEHMGRQVGILRNCRAVALVTVPEGRQIARALQAQVPTLRKVIVADELAAGGALPRVRIAAGDLAFVQYTSGSTGDPKGVMLTHANLMANVRAMLEANAVTADDRFVSWLPLYHDMGLIGAWMSSMTSGMHLAVMSPVTFLRRPSRWLWAIHQNRGTISGGPNFAYARCAATIDDAEIEGLDLSSWRLAFNGAEPVSANTLVQFEQRFARYGFRREALAPVYGLAEASVGLTFPPPGRGPIIDHVERKAFTRDGRALPVPAAVDGLDFVACGGVLGGHELRIVDPRGSELPDRQEGHIHFRGPSATSGYLHNPAATERLMVDGWLDTGDLGYLCQGDLYVTGRVKDMIVRAGRNLHPSEIEEVVSAVDGVRAGCVAVFGTRSPGVIDERLIVVAETRLSGRVERSELSDRIAAACVAVVDVPPDEIVLVAPGTVPKTSSGKIRRGAARQLHETDALRESRVKQRLALARFVGRAATGQVRRFGRQGAVWAWALWAWTTFAVVGLAAVAGLAVIPGQRRRRRFGAYVSRRYARLAGVHLDVSGLDRLPDGPTVLAPNHPSFADGFVLAAILPERYTFVAAGELADRRIVGWGLRRLAVRFVTRTERSESIEHAGLLETAVGAGESLIIFPEGHVGPTAAFAPFRMGAFSVAANARVPVTPVTLHGTRHVLDPHDRRPRRGTVSVVVHEPVSAPSTDWEGAIALRNEVRSVMEEALQPTPAWVAGAGPRKPQPRQDLEIE